MMREYVLIDDRLKQRRAGGDFGEEHNAQRELDDKFVNRGYIKSSSSLSLDEEEEEYVQHHVDARKLKLWSAGGLFEELGGRMGKPKGVTYQVRRRTQ